METSFKVVGQQKNYPWGMRSSKCLAKLINSIQYSKLESSDIPSAEFWWGTHPQGMTQSKYSNKPLNYFFPNGDLSFLFKVLSIEKCLSLQIHPDRQNAIRLHENNETKKNYPDPYEKPELAIALKNFGGFIGFRSIEEIQNILESFNSFQIILKTFEKNVFESIKSCFMNLVSIGSQDSSQLDDLITNLKMEIEGKEELSQIDSVTLSLINQYGNDIGVLISLMLNYVELSPFQAILIPPNVPHCYFKGEILECMHSSNNVIRLGLTGKYKDKENLMNLMEYNSFDMEILQKNGFDKILKENKLNPSNEDLNHFLMNYETSFDELFNVKIILRPGNNINVNQNEPFELFKKLEDYEKVLKSHLKGSSSSSFSNMNEVWASSIIENLTRHQIIVNFGSSIYYSTYKKENVQASDISSFTKVSHLILFKYLA